MTYHLLFNNNPFVPSWHELKKNLSRQITDSCFKTIHEGPIPVPHYCGIGDVELCRCFPNSGLPFALSPRYPIQVLGQPVRSFISMDVPSTIFEFSYPFVNMLPSQQAVKHRLFQLVVSAMAGTVFVHKNRITINFFVSPNFQHRYHSTSACPIN